jgi:hypothetical protein
MSGITPLSIICSRTPGDNHFSEEADMILGGSLIPPEREKKDSKK